jgi:Domain of unknown function (DUF4249)
MLKMRPKFIIALVGFFTLCTCIDPYVPNLKGYQPLLVIDGLISDADASYTVRLSKTFQEQDGVQTSVTDATVFITDDAGNTSYLINKGNGSYKTDSLEFRGVVGRTYVLHVDDKGGNVYESDPCQMQPVNDIDSVYFEKDQEIVNNGTETQDGLRIFLDAKEGAENKYCRWAFEEVWKYKVPDPKRYNYINDTTIIPVGDVKEFCWKIRESDGILIHSNVSGLTNMIRKQPVLFIASDQSDRLTVEYSILVKQYSISKNEYDFWNDLSQINESGADIFAKLPFTISSNIHNINDSKERVLGYFQVSALREKRKFITFSEIVGLNLPFYHYPCEIIQTDPNDYPNPRGPKFTWNQIYAMFSSTSDYYFIEPLYIPGTDKLLKLVFAKPECADCELTGTRTKPDFWVDMN